MKKIKINQVGYPTGLKKTASVSGRARKRFEVVNADTKKTVHEGMLREAKKDELSGEWLRCADFSELSDSGRYFLRCGIHRSAVFEISDRPYDGCLSVLLKAFWYQRCGIALEEKYGSFVHDRCHTEKSLFYSVPELSMDVSGGWHDAGDYGRYSVTGATALGHLLYAYKLFGGAFGSGLNLPESGNGIPDILNECRCELDWLMKMQDISDGGVYHKVTTELFCGFILPEHDIADTLIFDKTANASAHAAAAFALAAGIWRELDGKLSDELEKRAELAYAYAIRHGDEPAFKNPGRVNSGSYSDDDIRDDIFWAAAELYSLTGKCEYHNKIRQLYGIADTTGFRWNKIGGMGALAYIFTSKNKDDIVLAALRSAFLQDAEPLCMRSLSGSGVAAPAEAFIWGSNMAVAESGLKLLAANLLSPRQEYISAALEQLNYLLGKNPMGLSFVTSVGSSPVYSPHHRFSSADGIGDPIPGLVVGGPDSLRTDEYIRWNIPEGTPPAKCYIDDEASYSTNEVEICYNSIVVLLTAYFNQ